MAATGATLGISSCHLRVRRRTEDVEVHDVLAELKDARVVAEAIAVVRR